MKKKYQVMMEIKNDNYNFPKTIQQLAILINKNARKEKILNLIENNSNLIQLQDKNNTI
jgi:hypothetical protein